MSAVAALVTAPNVLATAATPVAVVGSISPYWSCPLGPSTSSSLHGGGLADEDRPNNCDNPESIIGLCLDPEVPVPVIVLNGRGMGVGDKGPSLSVPVLGEDVIDDDEEEGTVVACAVTDEAAAAAAEGLLTVDKDSPGLLG